MATSKLGINLRGLRRIRAILMKLYGDEFWSMSTVDVNTKWVEVVTLTRRCRLLEIQELVDPQDVAAPQYFISHTCTSGSIRPHECSRMSRPQAATVYQGLAWPQGRNIASYQGANLLDGHALRSQDRHFVATSCCVHVSVEPTRRALPEHAG